MGYLGLAQKFTILMSKNMFRFPHLIRLSDRLFSAPFSEVNFVHPLTGREAENPHNFLSSVSKIDSSNRFSKMEVSINTHC